VCDQSVVDSRLLYNAKKCFIKTENSSEGKKGSRKKRSIFTLKRRNPENKITREAVTAVQLSSYKQTHKFNKLTPRRSKYN
jgi:hypothetical protein